MACLPRSILSASSTSTPLEESIDLAALASTLRELGRVAHLRDLGTQGPLVAAAGEGSLFHCLFGRDAIRMAMDLLDDFPEVAHTTVIELARLQGITDNPRAEEEPGRILHEHRYPDDPQASTLRAYWDFPYFGAVDSTPQWINLLGVYVQRYGRGILSEKVTNRAWHVVSLRESFRDTLGWILRRLDNPLGGGYLWVKRGSPYGIPNQVWEDSPDSYYFEDGTLLDFSRPYAPVAVQGYVYDALLAAADLFESDASLAPVSPAALRERAAEIRENVLASFWQPDLRTFALALAQRDDGQMHPARVVASGPGHLLASRLLDGPDVARLREQLIARLLEPDMLAAAGIRTKSTHAARYLPGSYHNGSTWPMDTGVIADGLRRHEHAVEADDLDSRILRACAAVGGFPEFFRGEPDAFRVNRDVVDVVENGQVNRMEQPPQARQGWTATRVWAILRRHEAAVLAA